MNLKEILSIVQIVLSFVLVLLILSQNQSSGLSFTFGGGGSFYRSKRGIERLFFIGSIVVSALFLAFAVVIFYV